MLDPLLHMYGPLFLVVYAVVAAVVLSALRALNRRFERDMPRPKAAKLTDPYLIGALRGGREEAVRVAVVSLLARKLLKANGDTLEARAGASKLANRPLEVAVLDAYLKPGKVWSSFSDGKVREACRAYETTLRSRGLVASGDVVFRRMFHALLAVAILHGLAFAKVKTALDTGHGNVQILIISALLLLIIILVMTFRARTALGDDLLEDLQSLFRPLKARSNTLSANGESNELAFLVAVFGVAAAQANPSLVVLRSLFPKASASTASWGSSCGSSGGSSCGSSCGGGGCGGGCGGCGGCGS